MPEYLAPGVYVEETSFRAKTIEGVSTSTAGFVGPARFGPTAGVPELVTSFGQFERVFGGLDQLEFDGENGPSTNFLAQGVRTFFENGGQRLYVSRIYEAANGGDGLARTRIVDASSPSSGHIDLAARFPGKGGEVQVTFAIRLGKNVLRTRTVDGDVESFPGSLPAGRDFSELSGVNSFELVEVRTGVQTAAPPGTGRLYWVERRLDPAKSGPTWDFHDGVGAAVNIDQLKTSGGTPVDDVRVLTLSVDISFRGRTSRINAGRSEVFENLTFHPRHLQAVQKVFADKLVNPLLASSVPLIMTSERASAAGESLDAVQLARTLLSQSTLRRGEGDSWQYTTQLGNATDGARPSDAQYAGAPSDDPNLRSGLTALETIQGISIIAAPGSSFIPPNTNGAAHTRAQAVADHLIGHCERMKYRIAVLDSISGDTLPGVQTFRAKIDSTRAALYYPWVRVIDPVTEAQIFLPPSGFVTGIYARNDVEYGVHKSPANEIVRGALGFEKMLGKREQDVLNPEGINCLRFFEGRGYRVWGARTATSDSEWKYVNVRRYFAFLERSIDVNTQWVVFENNGPLLWAKVRRTVEDFLFNEWKSAHLLGDKPELAYFVKCDLTTMTQNDLDNGRLICLVGVAPLRPAEFVIFRIGQKTLAAQTV